MIRAPAFCELKMKKNLQRAVQTQVKGFDAAKSPLFDLKPERRPDDSDWAYTRELAAQYLIPKSTVLGGRINLIVPPGLDLNSEFGPLHTFVLQIHKDECKDMLESVSNNRNLMEKSCLGRELLRIAADFEKKPW